MSTDKQLSDMLRFDPLATAERVTGTSYKEDESTTWLGFGLMQENSQRKNAALIARGDTVLSNDLDRYVGIIESYGFERVLDVPFAKGERAEHFLVYWHSDGLLLSFDTYAEIRVNGGKVRYNWRPAGDLESLDRWHLTSSGHFTSDGVWIGDHDCREALIFNLENLRKHGEFVTPWVEQPFMWFCHYVDDSKDYRQITADRIALLPAHVQRAITPVKIPEAKAA